MSWKHGKKDNSALKVALLLNHTYDKRDPSDVENNVSIADCRDVFKLLLSSLFLIPLVSFKSWKS